MAPRPVTVVTAGRVGDGSSSWAQGGMAAAMGPDDSPALHCQDTIAAGGGLVQKRAAQFLCDAGPQAVEDLASAGVTFDRHNNGRYLLGKEAAHGRDRIVHVGGDEAGAAIMRTLVEKARQADHIEIREEVVVERLLRDRRGITGVAAWDITAQEAITLSAGAVVLATGGIGGLFAVTTNPLFSQGHGLTLAAEVGATLRDLEFVQFHPTALDVGRDPAPLATEAIRGAGGLLRDLEGERFMPNLHPDAELAPRDVVARGVASAIKKTGGAFLDVRGELGARFDTQFPTVARAAREAGFDPKVDFLPIAPAVHYHMGGIRTDLTGATDVPGLFAVGECASTGVHGANRLASNSLLEAIVFGSAAAKALTAIKAEPTAAPYPPSEKLHKPARQLAEVRQLMAKEAGILRNGDGLRHALRTTKAQTSTTEGGRLARMAASMVLASAMKRKESRGAHQRTDHPQTDANARHTLLRLRDNHFSFKFEDHPS